MPVIELKDCTVSYGTTKALDSISLSITQGEKVALIGPSGAGKSTLIRELYTLLGRKASLIHQQFALVPQLSVFHNVYIGKLDEHSFLFNLRNLFLPKHSVKNVVKNILTTLQIDEKLHSLASNLSGGQQQRVAVARALYRDAEYILGDEPVSSMDSHNGRNVLNLLAKYDKTIVLSMHDVDLALSYCNRIIGLQNGKILFDKKNTDVHAEDLKKLYSDL